LRQVEDGNVYVAVKQFKLKSSPEAFEQEKDNLRKLQDLDHLHMIRHHVTCELDNSYYVVFPWADGGNLSEYWKLETDKLRTPESALWMLRQMLGMADALAALHGRKCRHGDLKPENILHFNSTTDSILVIGDVGVSRFHKQDTFLRKDQTMTSATTPSYEAPEVYSDPQSPRSRKYDIWSLGCIFLEFTTWYLWDYHAIVAFREERVASDMNSYFYNNGRLDVHPKVTDAISSLLEDSRTQSDTALGHLLVLIRDDLLQVDVTRRAKAEEVASKLKVIVDKVQAEDLLMYKSKETSSSRPDIFNRHHHAKRPSNHSSKDSVMETSSFIPS
jgi:serine/threonine protein kinase